MPGKHSAPKPKRSKLRKVLLVIEIVCIIIALVCAGVLVKEVSKYVIADNDFKNVTQQTNREIPKLQELNGDGFGWLRVEDTRIDYPVMYTPDDPEYYLHRNVNKEYSAAGTLFIGEGSDALNPETNSIIIYGHHMRDGSMFGQLEKFADQDWAESHDIYYTQSDGKHTYHVIGAWHEDLSHSGYYRYWDNVGVLSEEQFNDYVSNVAQRSPYSTKYSAEYGDKLITLSTCSYGTSEERFVVVAVEK